MKKKEKKRKGPVPAKESSQEGMFHHGPNGHIDHLAELPHRMPKVLSVFLNAATLLPRMEILEFFARSLGSWQSKWKEGGRMGQKSSRKLSVVIRGCIGIGNER